MAILYPPYIEGTIPAFTKDGGLKVPFFHSPGVGFNEWDTMVCKITPMNDNKTTSLYITATEESFDNENKYINTKAQFNISSIDLITGEYYKIQLAYKNNSVDQNDILLNYSTVGMARYLGETGPTIEIKQIDQATYQGFYEAVANEAQYSYQFIVKEQDSDKIFYDTGVQLHNQTASYDYLYINKSLKFDQDYIVQYIITTINGYETAVSETFTAIPYNQPTIAPDVQVDYTKACVKVTMVPNSTTINIRGTYLLQRASDKDGYTSWVTLTTFVLGQDNSFVYEDNSIECGTYYKYGIVQTNEHGVHSDRRTSNIIETFFEDMYLSDSERALCIKYNPRVSSFKETKLEQKLDTIGSKYPFFFRNGNVGYKEFPISGLISYHQDEAESFIRKNALKLSNKEINTNLTDYNIYAERIFKTEVMNWLNNGKPKLFRSPVEGNFVVRLMNVSLSPNDTLGRMLHSFNCTAYETMEMDYDKMRAAAIIKPNIWPTNEELVTSTTFVVSSKAADIVEKQNGYYSVITGKILSAEFSNFTPGDIIRYGDQEIMIGATGMYIADTPANKIEIKCDNFKGYTGTINYQFASYEVTDFDKITAYQFEGIEGYSLKNNTDTPINVRNLLESAISNDLTIEKEISFIFRKISEGDDEPIIYNSDGTEELMNLRYTLGNEYAIDCNRAGQVGINYSIGKNIQVDAVVLTVKTVVEGG